MSLNAHSKAPFAYDIPHDIHKADYLIDMALEQRRRLFGRLPQNSAVLVSSGHEQIRNRDVEFPFRADSDFQYLTGFGEPDCVLLLVKKETAESVLFLRPRDAEQETWQGRRLGVEMASPILKVDAAYAIDEMQETVGDYLQNIDSLYFSFAQMQTWMEPVAEWLSALKALVRKGVAAPTKLCDLDEVMHEMRLFKSPQEIALMREAARISVQGHLAAMRHAADGRYEYQVQAELEAEFMRQGAQKVAFNSIVASGDNACILHYTENSDLMGEHQLLLVDAGAEFKGYAGDITNTFPVGGRFSEAQLQLYTLVLKAQQAAVAMVAPGVPYDQLHEKVADILTRGLIKLGILQGKPAQLIKSQAYKRFFMHGTGHWLGMDVHDVGQYKINGQWRELQPGMVVTIEPGLYIPAEAEDVDPQWWGIGIRIEDDVLVTETGHEVLTQGLPRSVKEIEAWMQENNVYLQKTDS